MFFKVVIKSEFIENSLSHYSEDPFALLMLKGKVKMPSGLNYILIYISEKL